MVAPALLGSQATKSIVNHRLILMSVLGPMDAGQSDIDFAQAGSIATILNDEKGVGLAQMISLVPVLPHRRCQDNRYPGRHSTLRKTGEQLKSSLMLAMELTKPHITIARPVIAPKGGFDDETLARDVDERVALRNKIDAYGIFYFGQKGVFRRIVGPYPEAPAVNVFRADGSFEAIDANVDCSKLGVVLPQMLANREQIG